VFYYYYYLDIFTSTRYKRFSAIIIIIMQFLTRRVSVG